jgi:hypothetical protein
MLRGSQGREQIGSESSQSVLNYANDGTKVLM